MKKQISDNKEVASLRMVRSQALARGDKQAADATLKQISILIAQEHGADPVAFKLYQSFAAREELLLEKHGHRQVAGRTRKSLREKGLVPSLEAWAGAKTPTSGFESLVGNDLTELTAEAIVLQHPEQFSEETLTTAQNVLLNLKVDRLNTSGESQCHTTSTFKYCFQTASNTGRCWKKFGI